MCRPLANRSGDQASRKKVGQEQEHQGPSQGEQEPSHVCLWIKQRVEHKHPKRSGQDRDADGDEHGSGKAGKIPRELVVDGSSSPPGGVDFDGQPLGKRQLRFLRAPPVAQAIELRQMRVDGSHTRDGFEEPQVSTPELDDADAAEAESNIEQGKNQAEKRNDEADVEGCSRSRSGEGESGGEKSLHGGEVVHARVENMILMIQALENLVPGEFRVGEMRSVAHRVSDSVSRLSFPRNAIVHGYAGRLSDSIGCFGEVYG